MVIPQEGKVVVNLVENVKGEKFKHFINFCLSISDEISLAAISRGQMLKEEARAARHMQLCRRLEGQDETAEEVKEQREGYEEEMQHIEENAMYYMQNKQGIDEMVNKYLGEYKLMKREVTCETHCTQGGPQVVYSFENEAKIQARLKAAKTIFDRVVLDEKEEFELEDPGFYKDGKLICSICSHEQMGSLLLDEAQYKVFRLLRIPHDIWTWAFIEERMHAAFMEEKNAIVQENMTYYPLEAESDANGRSKAQEAQKAESLKKAAELVEALKEYAYQERENVTIWGWNQEYIPQEIGDIKSLKKLEIFDHTVKYLPQSLEKLTALECLRITGNQVEELGFDIAKLQKLLVLDLSSMPLQVFPEGIVKLKNLKALYFSGKELRALPEGLMALKHLEVLSIQDMNFENISPKLAVFIKRLTPKQWGIDLKDIIDLKGITGE